MKYSTPNTIRYAQRMFTFVTTTTAARSSPWLGRPRMALPIPIFNWKITDGHYGFRSHADRTRAISMLKQRFGGLMSAVDYRDTRATFAAQLIWWLPGQRGGARLNSKGQFVSSIHRRVIASAWPRITQ